MLDAQNQRARRVHIVNSARNETITLAAEFAGHQRGLAAFFTRYRPYICPFDSLLSAVPRRTRMLDIGCGNGLFLYMAWAQGRLMEGIGFDLVANEITAGRRALMELGVEAIDLQVATDSDAWPPGSFDVVSVIDVMHHVPSKAQREFLEKACVKVAPGGKLIYKDMCHAPAWRAWGNRLHDLLKARQWIHHCLIEDVEQWVAGQGFELTLEKTINMYFYGHELRVFERRLS